MKRKGDVLERIYHTALDIVGEGNSRVFYYYDHEKQFRKDKDILEKIDKTLKSVRHTLRVKIKE